MNYNFSAERSRRIPTVGDSLDAKYRCLFFSKIAIHISICALSRTRSEQQRQSNTTLISDLAALRKKVRRIEIRHKYYTKIIIF
jgi:hypothetical protein